MTVRPTLRSFAFDVAVFVAAQVAGKKAKAAVAFLNCAHGAAEKLGDGVPRSYKEAFDKARGVFFECGDALEAAGAGAVATAAAAFYGGSKLGFGSVDALAALLQAQRATLRMKRVEPTVSAGGSCGVIATGDTWKGRFAGGGRQEIKVELKLESGQARCSEAKAALLRYTALTPNDCGLDGGNTCQKTQAGWTCSAPTAGSYPVLVRCERTDGSVTTVGTDAVGPAVLGPIKNCGDPPGVDIPGPFAVRSNIGCEGGFEVANAAISGGDQGGPRREAYGFRCSTSEVGFESAETTCEWGERRVTFNSGS